MDGQEYLNQISATNRPAQKSKNGILSSKFFLVGAIGVVALIIIVVIGLALGGGGKGGEKNLSHALYLHLNNTAEEIQEFQSSVKSSELRSSGASLNGILVDTSSKLESYLKEKSDFKDKDISKNIVSDADLAKDELYNTLFEAKINGNLDRIFAHTMAYEITMFMTEENKLINTTKSEDLQNILKTSYDSLDNLYAKFNEFSETK